MVPAAPFVSLLGEPSFEVAINLRTAQEVEVVKAVANRLMRRRNAQCAGRIVVPAERALDRHQAVAAQLASEVPDVVRRRFACRRFACA